ncbi:hypothetical protein C7S18_19490 [Ahniella affigens]|uniref:Uncharacterized protein n=1 Tax=Ahniella affigens TaxID=2021234 RepID=A0A2P1PWH8_9GAMM|nr:hypothetical protein [Ahniella affigens]AVP99211.1 hypothetical protein C7S18_19490 [Ahniella affigens]
MRARTHWMILAQAIVIWLLFWLAGLPNYYQQYSPAAVGFASIILSALIALACMMILVRVPAQRRMRIAFWLSIYYTVPFAALDAWYCGIYLGHGAGNLWQYWYLTAFYLSPWLSLMPVARLLNQASRHEPSSGTH